MADTDYGVLFTQRVAWGLDQFPPEDQARIRSSVGHLIGPAALEKLGKRVRELPTDEPLYSFRVTPDLQIIFSRRGDIITVVDLVRRETLEAFAASSAPKVAGDEPGSRPSQGLPGQPDRSRPPKRTEPQRGSRGGRRKVGHAE